MLKFNAYSERNGGYYSCVYTPRNNGKSVVVCTSQKQGYAINIAVEDGVDWRTAIAEHTLRLVVRGGSGRNFTPREMV